MPYKVALCGLALRDERLIEIVIARALRSKFRYEVGTLAKLGNAHLAVGDANSWRGQLQIKELRAINPNLIVVYISDDGLSGESHYRIERRSLLSRINRILDEAVTNELIAHHEPTAGAAVRHWQEAQYTPARSQPDLPESDTAPPGTTVPSKKEPLPPLRALVVDDSLTVRELLCSALERVGILSEQAKDADTAMSKLATDGYDLIFLDVVMPGTDGYEVCRNIKGNAQTRSIPVLMLTSRSSPFDRTRGALAGCDSYLAKPTTLTTVLTTVDKVLTKQVHHDQALLHARGYRAPR